MYIKTTFTSGSTALTCKTLAKLISPVTSIGKIDISSDKHLLLGKFHSKENVHQVSKMPAGLMIPLKGVTGTYSYPW